ncbi:PaeR7I family type II restriction endonuclease [Amycolatopsis sp. NPDC049868]|uniref:PaeR7I family type II restriction endonuclease n=1 Tax=Amycolatopsis sp. NPDC049868 TaxID=3363934 RepID=UPI0037A64674
MTPEQYAEVAAALDKFWEVRKKARDDQDGRGVSEPGERAGVTAGGHLDHVAHMLAMTCVKAGAPATEVYYKAPPEFIKSGLVAPGQTSPGYTLPGFYRPTKAWDVVVRANRRPIVAIELKSQLGPSYGNNANNRAEEAIGTATDLTKAVEQGLLPGKPWTGYVYVIEDDPASSIEPGRKADQIFHPKDDIFDTASYQDRVRILCQRLVEEDVYDSTWAVATRRPYCPNEYASESAKKKNLCPYLTAKFSHLDHETAHGFDFKELDTELSGYAKFANSLTAVIQKHYPSGQEGRPFREHWDSNSPTLFDHALDSEA